MDVVLASRNSGKLQEMQSLLAPLGMNLHSQKEMDLGSVEETGSTFIENALQKARHAARHFGWAAIADDSGLVVPALNGDPGIFSARYAGTQGDDTANNQKLVETLKKAGLLQHADDGVAAYFYCALVFLRSAEDPTPIVATAAWHGEVIEVPRGSNGFGYDPHFRLGALTSAELPTDEKNQRSHRAQASRKLLDALRDELILD